MRLRNDLLCKAFIPAPTECRRKSNDANNDVAYSIGKLVVPNVDHRRLVVLLNLRLSQISWCICWIVGQPDRGSILLMAQRHRVINLESSINSQIALLQSLMTTPAETKPATTEGVPPVRVAAKQDLEATGCLKQAAISDTRGQGADKFV